MENIGVGVIGCGKIAESKHIPCLLREKQAHLVGLCDLAGSERPRMLKEKFSLSDCRAYASVEEMLKDPAIHVVHICTPNAFHAELAIAALRSGKHVFCEKPMAVSLKEAKQMAQEAEKQKRSLTVCANHRFRPESLYLKELCRQKALGEIYYAKASILRRRGVPAWGQFLQKEVQGGGALVDVGVHALDLCLWLLEDDPPVAVTGHVYDRLGKQTSAANPYGSWTPEQFHVEDFGVGIIRLQSGATVCLEASWMLNTRRERGVGVELYGTRAGADMGNGLWINGERNSRLYNEEILFQSSPVAFQALETETLAQKELHLWLEALSNGQPPVVRPEQMVRVMSVLEGIYRSSREGHTVRLNDD